MRTSSSTSIPVLWNDSELLVKLRLKYSISLSRNFLLWLRSTIFTNNFRISALVISMFKLDVTIRCLSKISRCSKSCSRDNESSSNVFSGLKIVSLLLLLSSPPSIAFMISWKAEYNDIEKTYVLQCYRKVAWYFDLSYISYSFIFHQT